MNEQEKQGDPIKGVGPMAKPQADKAAADKLVNEAEYDKYTGLKFLQLSGVKLKEEQAKELDELETKIKKCSGKKSIRTVRAAIRNEQVLLVEGMPMPEKIQKIVEDCPNPKYYFGK